MCVCVLCCQLKHKCLLDAFLYNCISFLNFLTFRELPEPNRRCEKNIFNDKIGVFAFLRDRSWGLHGVLHPCCLKLWGTTKGRGSRQPKAHTHTDHYTMPACSVHLCICKFWTGDSHVRSQLQDGNIKHICRKIEKILTIKIWIFLCKIPKCKINFCFLLYHCSAFDFVESCKL